MKKKADKKQLMIHNSTAEFLNFTNPEDSVVRNFLTTATDGKNYNTQFYSLDAVSSVGYRVISKRATEFRRWGQLDELDHPKEHFAHEEINLQKFV